MAAPTPGRVLSLAIVTAVLVWPHGATAARAQGTPALDVTIDEIAWMGTLASTADEWIELVNRGAGQPERVDPDGGRRHAEHRPLRHHPCRQTGRAARAQSPAVTRPCP